MNTKPSIKETFIREIPFFLTVPAFMWQILFFCLPLFFIVILSFFKSNAPISYESLTLENYTSFFLDVQFLRILWRSFLLAFINATISVFLAYPVAFFLVFRAKRWRNFLLLLLILPFWTNLLVQVYSWFFVLERYGLINSLLLKAHIIQTPLHLLNTPLAIYIVMLSCYLPFMIMPLYASLEKFDVRFWEASADLGARTWQTFLRVILPLSVPGIRTGFFLVFVPSFGEFVIPALMGGGKQMYVGSLISHYFLIARNPQLGAAFTCLMGITLMIAVFFFYHGFKKIVRIGR